MKKNRKNSVAMISTGSMADIAFLLLIFFLVTTTIVDDKGLMLKLPPKQHNTPIAKVHERNLFKVQINSANKVLVQGEVWDDINKLSDEVKKFILNPDSDLSLSENPKEAIISLKTNRGTSYHSFIAVLDELQAAYYEIYGERTGITAAQFRKLDRNEPSQRKIYDKGKAGIPMNISIAEADF